MYIFTSWKVHIVIMLFPSIPMKQWCMPCLSYKKNISLSPFTPTPALGVGPTLPSEPVDAGPTKKKTRYAWQLLWLPSKHQLEKNTCSKEYRLYIYSCFLRLSGNSRGKSHLHLKTEGSPFHWYRMTVEGHLLQGGCLEVKSIRYFHMGLDAVSTWGWMWDMFFEVTNLQREQNEGFS